MEEEEQWRAEATKTGPWNAIRQIELSSRVVMA